MRWQPASLRVHLLLIVATALVPLLVFSVVLVVLLAQEQRATLRRGATERTRALLTAIDTELKRSIAALEALATSDRLAAGNISTFRVQAERALASRSEWLNITLALPAGTKIMRAVGDAGGPNDEPLDRESLDRAVATERPTIGSLVREPLTGALVFPVRVPVHVGGRLRYVLSAQVKPDAMAVLLAPQGLPLDWVGVVLDQNRVIVARTIGPHLVGSPASNSLQAALDASPEGWFRGSTIEDWPVYTPYHRSAFSRWTVAFGIPAATVDVPLRRSLSSIIFLGMLCLTLGVVLAWALSRRAASAVARLARAAGDLGAGRSAPSAFRSDGWRMPIAEIESLGEALANAASLIDADRRSAIVSKRRCEAPRLPCGSRTAERTSFSRCSDMNFAIRSASSARPCNSSIAPTFPRRSGSSCRT